MKKILFILFAIVIFKAQSQVYIGADGGIHPTGNYPAYLNSEGKSTWRGVADTTERNNIPANQRLSGRMFVYTYADSSLWLLDSTHNPIWVLYSQGTIIGNFVTRNTTQTIPSFKTFNPSITIPQGQTNYGVDIIPTFTAGGDTATGIGLHIAPTFNAAGHSNTTFKALQVDNGVTVVNGSAYFNRGAGSDLGGINLSRIIQGYSSLDTASWGRKYIGFYDSAGVGWMRINNNHTVAINDSIASHALKVGGTIQTDSLIISKLQTGTAVNSLLVDAGGNVIKGAIGGGGTVTSIATNNGTGITGGTIVSSGTLSIDTTNIISTIANARRIADSAAAAQNITSYRTVYVDSATGNNSTGQVGNPAKPYKNIDTAIAKGTLLYGDTLRLVVKMGLGVYPSPKISRGNLVFIGTAMPQPDWQPVAPNYPGSYPKYTTPNRLLPQSGTIWTGVFYDTLYSNVELHNLGGDVGKTWCDANRAGASSDMFMFGHSAADTTLVKKGIVIENVIALGYRPTSTSHAMLVEACWNPQVRNVTTIMNTYGLVIKAVGAYIYNHTGFGHSYAGLFTKSNGYAPCENIIVDGDQEYPMITAGDNGGLNAINQDIGYIRNIIYNNIIAQGTYNGWNFSGIGNKANTIYLNNFMFGDIVNNGVGISSNAVSNFHISNGTIRKCGNLGMSVTDDTTGLRSSVTDVSIDSCTVWGGSFTSNNTLNPMFIDNITALNSGGSWDLLWFGTAGVFANSINAINWQSARQNGTLNAGSPWQSVMAIGHTSTIAPVVNANNSYFGASTSQVNLGTDIIASNWNPQSGGSVLDATKPAWTFTYIPGGSARENFALYTSPNTAINSSVYAIDAVTGKFRINNPSAYATSVTTAQLQVTGGGYFSDSLQGKYLIVNNLSNSPNSNDSIVTAKYSSSKGAFILYRQPVTALGLGMAIGSTVTSATQGSVFFAGTGGILEQDNSNFFYDSTNKRLGLKTTSPSSVLHILTPAIVTTQNDANGILLQNNTAATSGVPVQDGPPIVGSANAWNTTSLANNEVRYRLNFVPVSGASTSWQLLLQSSINNGAYSTGVTFTSGGSATFAGNVSASTGTITAGGSMSAGTTSPAASAIFTMNSTTKGFLPPILTTTQQNAVSSPATGLIIWNSDSLNLVRYTGTAWLALGSLTGNNNYVFNGTAQQTGNFNLSGNGTLAKILGNTSTPSIAAGAAAGTSPTITITGTDMSGIISIVAGTSPTTGDLCDVTFTSSFPNSSRVVFSPTSTTSSAFGNAMYVTNSASGFSLNTTSALSAGITYTWNYVVIGK